MQHLSLARCVCPCRARMGGTHGRKELTLTFFPSFLPPRSDSSRARRLTTIATMTGSSALSLVHPHEEVLYTFFFFFSEPPSPLPWPRAFGSSPALAAPSTQHFTSAMRTMARRPPQRIKAVLMDQFGTLTDQHGSMTRLLQAEAAASESPSSSCGAAAGKSLISGGGSSPRSGRGTAHCD